MSGVDLTGVITPVYIVQTPTSVDLTKPAVPVGIVNANPSTGHRIVLFGDSRSHNEYVSSGQTIQYPASGPFNCANIKLGSPFFPLTNAGVSSNTTSQMLARLNSDVISQNPDWVWVWGGVNDPGNAIGYATSISNLTSIYDAILATGAKIICVTEPGSSTWSSDATGVNIEFRTNLNNFIKKYVSTHKNCFLVDAARALLDPTTGAFLSSPSVSGDGTHPNFEGAARIGDAAYDALVGNVPIHDQSISNPYHLGYMWNGQAVGNNASGTNGWLPTTVTGNGPNGWAARVRATGAAVSSKVARTAGSWKMEDFAQLAITCTANGDGAGYYPGSGDEVTQAHMRYDSNWAGTTAVILGDIKKPVTGYVGQYAMCVQAGTTGGSEPTWGTQAGAIITDGTAKWMIFYRPVQGEQYYAECEFQTSGLNANHGAQIVLELDLIRIISSAFDHTTVTAGWFDLSYSSGNAAQRLPASGVIRTPVLTVPAIAEAGDTRLRYFRATVYGYGDAGSTFNLGVTRVNIKKVTSTS